MRVVVAHEWLTNWAGSEQVTAQLLRVAGGQKLITGIADPAVARRHLPDVSVDTLWPSRLPAAQRRWSRYALPLMAAWATNRIEADGLLVSSHFAAHGATVRFDGPSVVYYHTPARILWRPELELARLPDAVHRPVEYLALPALRAWDRRVGQHPTVVLANSTAVAQRIERAYGRKAVVLHPPVDTGSWASVPERPRRHALWLGRFVAYKRPDVAVETARRSGVPLLMIGDGPERRRLESEAPPHVRFLGHAPDAVVRDALAEAIGLLFPGEEDFGIAPVEALSAGVPVVAYAAGGALDYVRHGENGLLVGSQDPDAFAAALGECARTRWDTAAVRRSALAFDAGRFRERLTDVLRAAWGARWSPGLSSTA